MIKEPQSPGEFQRMSQEERNLLLRQRAGDSITWSGITNRCKCGPCTLKVKEGQREVELVVSNFSPVRHYENGMLWRCSRCGRKFLSDSAPDELSASHLDARVNNPSINVGSDLQVLPRK